MTRGAKPLPDLTQPFEGLPADQWPKMTAELVKMHPLKADELVKVVLATWAGIFDSRIGARGFRLGTDIRPNPQIMGHYLHELIPLEFQFRYPGKWRRESAKAEKDLVYIPDLRFSVEIKTSTHASRILGNRSYGQPTVSGQVGRKGKSGYYLAINFSKFGESDVLPHIVRIRFGWLDHIDWVAQKAATGQAASLQPTSERSKLVTLYERPWPNIAV